MSQITFNRRIRNTSVLKNGEHYDVMFRNVPNFRNAEYVFYHSINYYYFAFGEIANFFFKPSQKPQTSVFIQYVEPKNHNSVISFFNKSRWENNTIICESSTDLSKINRNFKVPPRLCRYPFEFTSPRYLPITQRRIPKPFEEFEINLSEIFKDSDIFSNESSEFEKMPKRTTLDPKAYNVRPAGALKIVSKVSDGVPIARPPSLVSVENLPNTQEAKEFIRSLVNFKFPGQSTEIFFESESFEFMSASITCNCTMTCLRIKQCLKELNVSKFFPRDLVIGTGSGRNKVNQTFFELIEKSEVKREIQQNDEPMYLMDDIRLKRLQFYKLSKPSDAIECFICKKWINKDGMEDHVHTFHPFVLVVAKARCPVCDRSMADSGKGAFELLPCGHAVCTSCVESSRQEGLRKIEFHTKFIAIGDKCPICRTPHQGYGTPMLVFE